MEIDVRGTKVVLRDRLPAREAWPLRQLMVRAQKGETLTFDEEAGALAQCVESWEFEGDPHDVESYAQMDLADFAVLDNRVAEYLRAKFTAGSKN